MPRNVSTIRQPHRQRITQLLLDGKSTADIMADVGCSPSLVCQLRRAIGIQPVSQLTRETLVKIIAQIINTTLTQVDIAKLNDTTSATVSDIEMMCIEYGLKKTTRRRGRPRSTR